MNAHTATSAPADKHDAGCRRRKVDLDFPYLCTCDLADEAAHDTTAQARGRHRKGGLTDG